MHYMMLYIELGWFFFRFTRTPFPSVLLLTSIDFGAEMHPLYGLSLTVEQQSPKLLVLVRFQQPVPN